MSFEDNDLFEGIQIMSPSELSSATNAEGNNEEVEETNVDVEIVPVVAESGDSDAEPKKDTPAAKETASPNVEKNEAVYKALIKTLADAGVITVAEQEQLEEMPGSVESIKKLVSQTIEETANMKQEEWKKGLSSEKKRFLEIEDAFDQTNQAIIMAQRLEFFDNISEDAVAKDLQLQKQLHYEQLTSLKNFTHEEALEAIEEAEATGKLKDKAIKAIPDLKTQATTVVEHAKSEKAAKTAAEVKAQEESFNKLFSTIEEREQFIDGLPLNKVAKDKLKNNIVSPVYKDPKSGKEFNSLMFKQMKNPVEFEMLVNYYDTLGLFDIDKEGKFKPNITKLKAVAKTAAITELDRVIASEEQRGVGRNTSVETSKTTQDTLDKLERIFKSK
jgi:hypothetical protein